MYIYIYIYVCIYIYIYIYMYVCIYEELRLWKIKKLCYSKTLVQVSLSGQSHSPGNFAVCHPKCRPLEIGAVDLL